MAVTKTDLVNRIANSTEVSKKDVKLVIDSFWTLIEDHVKKGEAVQFIGIGKFYKAHTNERNGRNPKTGETIKIPASDKLAFKGSLKFE